MPTGSPLESSPQGTEMAGTPAILTVQCRYPTSTSQPGLHLVVQRKCCIGCSRSNEHVTFFKYGIKFPVYLFTNQAGFLVVSIIITAGQHIGSQHDAAFNLVTKPSLLVLTIMSSILVYEDVR